MGAFRYLATFVVVSSAVAVAVWPPAPTPVTEPAPTPTAVAPSVPEDRLPPDARVAVFTIGGADGAVALDGAAGRRFRALLAGAEVLVVVADDGSDAHIRTVVEGEVVDVPTRIGSWSSVVDVYPRVRLLTGPRPEP